MSTSTSDKILDTVTGLLRDFHGRQFLGTIDRETRFFADLGLASIDAVVLGEELERCFDRPLPFGELMEELGSRSDRDIRIGELVDFLGRHVTEP